MIFKIVEHKHAESYELVVATSCLDLLSQKFQNFKLVVDYDPFESAEKNIRIHEIWEIKKRARINIFDNAAKVIRNEWEHESTKCYRKIIEKIDLETELERAILNWDIQVRYSHIHLSIYLLITFSIQILESLRISRKISYTLVWNVVIVITSLSFSTFSSEIRTIDFNLFETITQTYSSYWWRQTFFSRFEKNWSNRRFHYFEIFLNISMIRWIVDNTISKWITRQVKMRFSALVFWAFSVHVNLNVSTRKRCKTRSSSQDFSRNYQNQTYQIHSNEIFIWSY